MFVLSFKTFMNPKTSEHVSANACKAGMSIKDYIWVLKMFLKVKTLWVKNVNKSSLSLDQSKKFLDMPEIE